MKNFLMYVGLMVGLFMYAVAVFYIIEISIEKQKINDRIDRTKIDRTMRDSE